MKTHLIVNRVVRNKVVGHVACISSLWKSSGWPATTAPRDVTCKHCQKKSRRGIQLKLDLE